MALIQHLDTIRSKPRHVRERVAFGTAAGVTGLVGVIWVATLAATGTFALAPSQDALAGSDQNAAVAQSQTSFSQLVGAAGAALGATSTDPSLRIVNDGAQSSFEAKQAVANNSDATVIPF